MAQLQQIKKLLTGYPFRDQAAEDVHVLISNFKNLKAQDPREFVHYNGSTEILLCICGTIPVKVRGNTYHISIAIWVRKEHPFYKPIVFVTPTREMGVTPSRFVNTNGNVFLPYLDEWKQGVSDLTALTQVMCATFGEFCPVYDRRFNTGLKEPSKVISSDKAPYQYRATPESPKQQKPFSSGDHPSLAQMPIPHSHNYQPSDPSEPSQYPPYPVKQHPPYPVKQHPSYPVEQHPPYPVKQYPPYPGKQHLPYPVKQHPPYPGKQHPPYPGKQHPPYPGKQHSPYPVKQQATGDKDMQLPQALQLLEEKDRRLQGYSLQLAAAVATNQQLQQQLQSLQQSKDDQLREHTLQLHTASANNQHLQQQVQSLHTSLEEKELQLNNSIQSTCSYHSEFWEVRREDVMLNMHKILGTGAWGYVVEGQFRGQTIAVKCLHDLIRHPEVVSVIRQEISVMAQLRHPNLVLFIAAVLDEESDPLIITELLDVSLRKAYEKHLLIDMRSKGSIYRDVACALNYLHLHHHGAIIHRDVSSANVLLEGKPDKQWKAKLSDFGSAKLVADATTVGPGTMVYAAPEVHEKIGIQQSPMVDVYSYGVLLCEVTVEEFPTETKYAAMVQSIKDRWPNIFYLVTSCNSANPDNRPTMANILVELDKLKL